MIGGGSGRRPFLDEDMVWAGQKCSDVLRHKHGCSDPIYAGGSDNKMRGKYEDLTGRKFGKLFVLGLDPDFAPKRTEWRCKCDCGKEITTKSKYLLGGNSTSCGCSRHKYNDLSGGQFGDLTVLYRDETKSKVYYICQCKCGEITSVRVDGLTSGKVHSCGCSVESMGSRKIKQLLIDNHIKFKSEVWFSDLISPNGGHLRYDFGIIRDGEICELIEFDGRQHFEVIGGWWGGEDALKYRQQCDAMKDEYARQHNIPLIRISYKDEKKITIDMLLGEANNLLSA